jgi:hypothetical protein
MKGAPYRHIGGMVIADLGPLTLLAAADLALFYLREGLGALAHRERAAASACGERVLALTTAIDGAIQWRGAAGWKDPFAADRPDMDRRGAPP